MSTYPTFTSAYEEFIDKNQPIKSKQYNTDEGEVIFSKCEDSTNTTLLITYFHIYPSSTFNLATFVNAVVSSGYCTVFGCTVPGYTFSFIIPKVNHPASPPKTSPATPIKRSLKSMLEAFPKYTDEYIVGHIKSHPKEVNLVDDQKCTPLMLACSVGCKTSVIRTLIEAGSDVHALDENGWNALHYALSGGQPRPENVLELIRAGVNVNLKTNDGNTPLFFAAGRCVEYIELLVNAGADINVCDNNGCGVLWYAYDFIIFKYLLTLNLDVNHRNNAGLNILDYYLGRENGGEEKYCRLLIERNIGPTFNKLFTEAIERYVKLIKP